MGIQGPPCDADGSQLMGWQVGGALSAPAGGSGGRRYERGHPGSHHGSARARWAVLVMSTRVTGVAHGHPRPMGPAMVAFLVAVTGFIFGYACGWHRDDDQRASVPDAAVGACLTIDLRATPCDGSSSWRVTGDARTFDDCALIGAYDTVGTRSGRVLCLEPVWIDAVTDGE